MHKLRLLGLLARTLSGWNASQNFCKQVHQLFGDDDMKRMEINTIESMSCTLKQRRLNKYMRTLWQNGAVSSSLQCGAALLEVGSMKQAVSESLFVSSTISEQPYRSDAVIMLIGNVLLTHEDCLANVVVLSFNGLSETCSNRGFHLVNLCIPPQSLTLILTDVLQKLLPSATI